jgi:expansin (peptidoglycan-binding protein)
MKTNSYVKAGLTAVFLSLVCVCAAIGLPTAVAAPNAPPPLYLPFIVGGNDITIGPIHSGIATYYDATGEGNCLFPASPENLMVAAMNEVDYNNAALCGAYVRVDGRLGSVVVRIVDRCPYPECQPGHVDMSPEAFALIDDIPLGRVPITWQMVSPPLDGPIVYHFKDGSNQWWTAVQIRNHRNPIAKVEYRLQNGSFQQLPREMWNYFVATNGMGPGPYTFRVTDILGNVLVDHNIPHIENGSVSGSAQFPPP